TSPLHFEIRLGGSPLRELVNRDGQPDVLVDHCLGPPGDGRKGCPQNLVPTDDLVQTRPEGVHVQGAVNVNGTEHVVQGAARNGLIEEPQSALSARQWGGSPAALADD